MGFRIMFSAGEPSGDRHAADVVREILNRIPDAQVYGLGGPLMKEAGFSPLFSFEKFNTMGLAEIVGSLPFLIGAKNQFIKKLRSDKPDALVCVDYSGFNIPLAKAAKKLGIPVVWYIVPKFWAWKHKKYTTFLKTYVTKAAALFPFEPDQYNYIADNMVFVGNPLVEQMKRDGHAARNHHHSDFSGKMPVRIALVPGSRRQEIATMLPAMTKAVRILETAGIPVTVTISKWEGFEPDFFKEHGASGFSLTEEALETLFDRSDIAIVTSGTATLQAGLCGIPMLILYKAPAISFYLYRLMIKGIKNIGLPNIVAGKELVPELLQDDMNPEMIAKGIKKYLTEPEYYDETAKNLRTTAAHLGSKTASYEVTNLILSVVNR